MARFMEKFAVSIVIIPLPKSVPAEVYAKLPRNNFIDALYTTSCSGSASRRRSRGDATFHRRRICRRDRPSADAGRDEDVSRRQFAR